MTATAPPPLRVVSFGDLDGEIWGSAIDAGEPAIVFGSPDGTGSAAGAGSVSLTEEAGRWRIAGDGFELLVTPVPIGHVASDGPPAIVAAAEGANRSVQAPAAELCHVSGTLSVAGRGRPVECIGTRSIRDGVNPGRYDSLRGLSSWFDNDRGLALISLRPSHGDGHESDLVTATIFEPEGPVGVDEARFSTTFRSGGRPSRAGVELWIGAGKEQYSRRAAAEALGDGVTVDSDGVRLEVTPLRCHTAGLEGAGVYLLARL